MSTSSAEPRDIPRTPPEWPGLVASVEALVDPGLPYEEQGAAALEAARVVAPLGVERLTANSHHAERLALCAFAQTLNTPNGMRSFTQQAVDELVVGHPEYAFGRPNSDGLNVAEIVAIRSVDDRPFLETEPLPVSHRLLGAALSALTHHSDQPRDLAAYLPEILEDTTARYAQSVARDGAGLLLETVLERLHNNARGFGPKTTLPPGTLLKDIIATPTLRELDLEKLLLVGAGMRMTDLLRVRQDLVIVHPDGTVDVNHEAVPKKAELRVVPLSISQEHHRCPALYVQGLIPLIARLLPNIVADAQELIEIR